MKKSTALILLTLSYLTSFSQSRKKDLKEKRVNIISQISYNSFEEEFGWNYAYKISREDYNLTFLTSNSGTFEVEEDSLILAEAYLISLPSRSISAGFGIQFVNEKNIYQTISIPTLFMSESNVENVVRRQNIDDPSKYTEYRLSQKVKNLSIALRYDVGKYAGNIKKGMEFGLGAFIEPYFIHQITEYDNRRNGISGVLALINTGLNLSTSIKMGRKTFIDFNVSPFFRIGNIRNYQNDNPNFAPDFLEKTKLTSNSTVHLSASIMLKYGLKESDNRRRRRRR